MINIEKDIKILEESIQEAYRSYDYDLDYNPFSKGIAEVIERVLAERKQDKARIKELEEENRMQRKQIMSAYNRGWIPKQKVKDLIENETINISGFECIAVEDLEELLEESK